MALTSDALGRVLSRDRYGYRVWLITLGGALIILGIVAVGSSLATTYVLMVILSGVLLLGGILRVVAAFRAREWAGSLLLALSGVLYLVVAALTFRHPIAAALALTLLFSALLLGVGLFRTIGAIWYRFPNWGWIVFTGVISVLLGLMLWNAWPASGLWFIGFCVGIDMIVEGASWIKLALDSKNEPITEPATSANHPGTN